jgi:hypothetical protein
VPPTITATGRPAPGYELLPGLAYYKLHTTLRNWLEASHICRKENVHLLVINSEAEAMALTPVWASHPILGDWRDWWSYVGIHDQFQEGKFVTIVSKYNLPKVSLTI